MHKIFKKINWLSIHEVLQCFLCSEYSFFMKDCPNYFNEMYVPLEINVVCMHSYQTLNVPHQKNKCLMKSLILCWSLTLEQFKQGIKNFN